MNFFERLYQDQEFCETLGKVTLAAGRFESDLRTYLRLRGAEMPDRSTFGQLINALKDRRFLSENGVRVLRHLAFQRNYLTHSLFDLLSFRIKETVLPREDLDVVADVSTYVDKAWELEQNLSGMARLVEEKIKRLQEDDGLPDTEYELLFRP
jgi:hypothetical protein